MGVLLTLLRISYPQSTIAGLLQPRIFKNTIGIYCSISRGHMPFYAPNEYLDCLSLKIILCGEYDYFFNI